MSYAGALLRMAELCVAQNSPKLAALSADGQSRSELERRILRLMNLRHGSKLRLTPVGVMIIAIAIMLSAVAPAMLSARNESDISAETQAAAVAIEESDLPFEWSIPGTVTDEKGKPVAGAIIETLPGLQKQVSTTSADFSGLPNLATTDVAGIVEFPWIPAGLQRGVSFEIRDPRYHCPKPPLYETVDSDMTARVLRVASVRGKVTLANGTPVSGVRLQAEGRGNTTRYFRGHTTARIDGSYEFDIYPDQNTIVAITDTNYAAKSHMDVLLKEGQSREDVDFVVSDGTLIRGTITLGKDRLPAVGDRVTLIQSADGTDLVRWSAIDANGFYRFRVGLGTYELRLPNQEAAAPIMINVKDEEEVVYDGHAERRSRVNLSGIVIDASAKPVANCKVYGESIAAPGHAGFQTTTNADGKFNSDRWSDSMLVYAIQGKKMLAGYTEISEDSTDVAVKLAPATAASGFVRRKDGQPVADVRVQLNVGLPRAEGQCNLNLWTTTDEDGAYTFIGLVPGALCSVIVYRADQHTNGPKFEVNDLGSVVLDDVVIAPVPVAALVPNDQSGHEPNQVPDAAPADGSSEKAVTVR